MWPRVAKILRSNLILWGCHVFHLNFMKSEKCRFISAGILSKICQSDNKIRRNDEKCMCWGGILKTKSFPFSPLSHKTLDTPKFRRSHVLKSQSSASWQLYWWRHWGNNSKSNRWRLFGAKYKLGHDARSKRPTSRYFRAASAWLL